MTWLIAYSTVSCCPLALTFLKAIRSTVHSKHVIHGDLSGVCTLAMVSCYLLMLQNEQSNVLVHANGSACIADFGLSTLLTAIGGPTFATSRQAKGTVRWMAPELFYFDDSQPITIPTVQSDVYSFGSIMLQVGGTSVIPSIYYVYWNTRRFWQAISRITTSFVTNKSLLPFWKAGDPTDLIGNWSRMTDWNSSKGVGL